MAESDTNAVGENASSLVPFSEPEPESNTNWSMGIDWLAFDIADAARTMEMTPAAKVKLAASDGSVR